jgi:uncharacterized membrane protein (DUF485 family)
VTNTPENNQTIETIERLQQSYSNIKIFTAVPMGVLLIVYFFTFGMLIDKGMDGALMFEIVTSILFVLYFIFINQSAFAILKYLNRNKPQYKDVLTLMTVSDLAMKPDALSVIIENRR